MESKPAITKFDIFARIDTLNIDEITKHIIKELHNAGYIIDDMAEIMGISDRKIYRYLKNMDVERRNKYYNKEKIWKRN